MADCMHLSIACWRHFACSGCLPYQSRLCLSIGSLHLHRQSLAIGMVDAKERYEPDGVGSDGSCLRFSEQKRIQRWLASVVVNASCKRGTFHKNPGGPIRT